MIKVNLLRVKKKKKAAQIPGYAVAGVLVAIVTAVVMFYLFYFFNSKVETKKKLASENEQKIAELEKKIKDVADYEKRNEDFKARKEIIEKLGKIKTIPARVIDGVSAQLPNGVWLTAFDFRGSDLTLNCTGFTNTDVVNFVDNLKGSKMFSDVYLKESVQTQVTGFSVYTFSITLKVNG
jgi:type IV pilus assembly protein PilN